MRRASWACAGERLTSQRVVELVARANLNMEQVFYFKVGRTPSSAPHAFLRRVPPPDDRPIVREIALGIVNAWSARKYTRKELRNGEIQLPWFETGKDAQGNDVNEDRLSKRFSLFDLEQALRLRNAYHFKEFDMPDPGCPWLDDQVIIANELQVSDTDGSGNALAFAVPTKLGPTFPITPTLNREGWAVSSFQRAVAIRIHRLWTSLVDSSDRFFSYDWLQDLRGCVSECVSLIDITLHQLYWKALYDPLPTWRFDAGKLGSPHARRMSDKLRWVTQISGNHVHADAERRGFTKLRVLRNHLQHFDPPCFACHLDEAAEWLNNVRDTARFAMKIRHALGSPLSSELIALLLLPDVEFVPLPSDRPRLPPKEPAGYEALMANAPQPPAETPVASASLEDVERMLRHVEAIRGGKTDTDRMELTRMILRLLADLNPERAAREAQERGL